MIENKKLILVDGSSYIFRAFHALPPMNRSDGMPINAVFGFTSMLLKLSDDFIGNYFAVVFDAGRKTFRNDIYPEYKANRGDPPEDLIPQFPMFRKATDALGLISLEIEGYEADDIIATLSKFGEKKNLEIVIVSSDKDLMQLVKENVYLFDPMKNKKIDEIGVKEKFGVYPSKVVDVQSLAGDTSDNVPGIPGIGVKTAAQLINEFGNLENLLDNAEKILQNKRRENIINFSDSAIISKKLVKLKDDVEIHTKIEQMKWEKRDNQKLINFLKENEFKRLLDRFSQKEEFSKTSDHNKIKKDYKLIVNEDNLKLIITECIESGVIAIDTETDSLRANEANLVGISISTKEGNGYYIPIGHKENDGALAESQLAKKIVLPLIKNIFEDKSILKIGHNIKYDSLVLRQKNNGNINIYPVEDTLCLSYVIDAGRISHKLDTLALDYLNYNTIKFEDICGSGSKKISFDKVKINLALNYAAEDADITLRLFNLLKSKLIRSKLVNVYETLERPLIKVLENMESVGIKIEKNILQNLSDEFKLRLIEYEEEIFKISNEKFNIASPKQLGEVLFKKMNLPGGKKTKSGAFGTSINVLEEMASKDIKIAKLLIEWRSLTKLKSTYSDALQETINILTGRVHTSFSMSSASTGRLSSSDPNLQNIPIRTLDGKRIREAFIPCLENKIFSADYSQIELRLIAHVSNEEALLEAFKNEKDIHKETACKIFNVLLDQVDNDMRRKAKTINFGIIYGISPFGLAKQLNCTRQSAKEFIDEYFLQFPGIKKYMDKTIEEAKKYGFVKTIFGRKIPIIGLNSKNFSERGFSERQAINAPIQGSAADIIKRAMIRINDYLNNCSKNTKMLLQVHDELVFEVPEDEMKEINEKIIFIMENAHLPYKNLNVPIKVDANFGNSWADAH